MKFEDRLSELMNEVDVPDELSPQNIALMLKTQSAQSKMEAEYRNIKSAPSIAAQRRTIIMRTAAAVAACAVFATGMWAYNENRAAQEQLEAPINYEAVSPESYDDLLDIYTGITLEQNDTEPDSERTLDETAPPVSEEDIEAVTNSKGESLSDADVIKSDESYIYCLKDSILYIISKETMEIVSEIESKLTPPVEIYVEDGKVFLISEETEETQVIDSGENTAAAEASKTEILPTASDVPANDADFLQSAESDSDTSDAAASDDNSASQAASQSCGESAIPDSNTARRINVITDIYNVSDPKNPVRMTSYKQNGSFISSKIVDGVLYMVTAYTDYRVKPLDTQADLDSFVPAYYFNDEKNYVAAENIIVPSNAASTDYTVVSAVNFNGSEITANVKAVLGGGKFVHCSADALYIASIEKKEAEYSVISAFDLSDGNLSYRSSCSVAGTVFGNKAMDEYNGQLRVAAKVTDKGGIASASVYVLDKSLTVINSAGQLIPGGNITEVRFENKYAKIIGAESAQPALMLDLSVTPPVISQTEMSSSAYLCNWSDSLLIGVSKAQNSGINLTMYDSASSLAVNNTVIGEGEIFSAALTDKQAVLIDSEKNIIGIPVYTYSEFGIRNSYYIFSYSNTGFEQKGIIEYIDVDDSMIFRRGEINGDTLYIIGTGRIVSARLSDMKVIGTFEY